MLKEFEQNLFQWKFHDTKNYQKHLKSHSRHFDDYFRQPEGDTQCNAFNNSNIMFTRKMQSHHQLLQK